MVAAMILAVAIAGTVALLGISTEFSGNTEETTTALYAARKKIEEIRSQTYSNIFFLYNDLDSDDPAGTGTAPGEFFAVPGLSNPSDGNLPGRIRFPDSGTPGLLREDTVDSTLSMPMDMDGNGSDDDTDDKSTTYLILPLEITVRWSSGGRDREITLPTILAEEGSS